MRSDPIRASELLERDVRKDSKASSTRSLSNLFEVDHPAATKAIIRLLDCPDGRWVSGNSRELMIAELKRRFSDVPPGELPHYDPGDSMESRALQRSNWEKWFEARQDQLGKN